MMVLEARRRLTAVTMSCTALCFVLTGCQTSAQDEARAGVEAQRSLFEQLLDEAANEGGSADDLRQAVLDDHVLTDVVLIVVDRSIDVDPATFDYPTSAVFDAEVAAPDELQLDVYFSGIGDQGGLDSRTSGAFTCRTYRVDSNERAFNSQDTDCPTYLGDQSRLHLIL